MAQIDNVLLATQARMMDNVLSAGPSAPAAPPSNLLLKEPSDPLTWTDLSQTWVRGVMPSSRSLRLAWLGYLSCTDDAQYRVVFRNGGLDVYDSGLLDCVPDGEDVPLPHRKNRRHCWHLLDEAVTADEWEVTVSDPDNPAGVLHLGKLIVDDPFQPERNTAYGLQPPSLYDPSRVPAAAQGQRPALNRTPYDIAAFDLRWGSRQEMIGELRNLVEFTGTTRPVLAILEPRATSYRDRMSIYGLLEALPAVTLPFFNIFSAPFRIEGLIP